MPLRGECEPRPLRNGPGTRGSPARAWTPGAGGGGLTALSLGCWWDVKATLTSCRRAYLPLAGNIRAEDSPGQTDGKLPQTPRLTRRLHQSRGLPAAAPACLGRAWLTKAPWGETSHPPTRAGWSSCVTEHRFWLSLCRCSVCAGRRPGPGTRPRCSCRSPPDEAAGRPVPETRALAQQRLHSTLHPEEAEAPGPPARRRRCRRR